MSENSSQVFKTHSNYISAIRYIASGGILDNTEYALNLLASKVYDSGCLNFEIKKEIDKKEIHHTLNNAWGIEALFKTENVLINEDDLIRLSNNWCIVQTYCVLFYSTQALSITEGYTKPTTHPLIHRNYYLLWTKMPWLISPWCITYNENGFLNLQPDIEIDDHIHSWRKVDGETALSLYCKALRTTRDEFIEEALSKRRQRRADEKGTSTIKLTDKQKRETNVRVRPTSLITYLFRLKRRTSYEQSSALALGPENDYQSKELRDNLSFIIESTLLVSEFIISKIVGEDLYYSWCKEWDKYKSPAFQNLGPEKRFEIIF